MPLPSQARPQSPAKLLVAIFAFSCAVFGCGERRDAQRAAAKAADLAAGTAAKGPPAATYTLRGQIEQLPDPTRPQSEFQIHHEAIDTFADHTGKVLGMSAMVMPFPLGPGVSLNGLHKGDKVEFSFAVWWDGPIPDYHITKLSRLDPATPIEFRAARSPTPTTPTTPTTSATHTQEPAKPVGGG